MSSSGSTAWGSIHPSSCRRAARNSCRASSTRSCRSTTSEEAPAVPAVIGPSIASDAIAARRPQRPLGDATSASDPDARAPGTGHPRLSWPDRPSLIDEGLPPPRRRHHRIDPPVDRLGRSRAGDRLRGRLSRLAPLLRLVDPPVRVPHADRVHPSRPRRGQRAPRVGARDRGDRAPHPAATVHDRIIDPVHGGVAGRFARPAVRAAGSARWLGGRLGAGPARGHGPLRGRVHRARVHRHHHDAGVSAGAGGARSVGARSIGAGTVGRCRDDA